MLWTGAIRGIDTSERMEEISTAAATTATTIRDNGNKDSTQDSSNSDGGDVMMIDQMAHSGLPLHPWRTVVGPALERRIGRCLDEFRATRRKSDDSEEDFLAKKQEIIAMLHQFYNAPFTLQRICEIVQTPDAHYKSVEALLRGFEVLLSVSSTIPQASDVEVDRLRKEYERVTALALPGSSNSAEGTPLRRTDTVEMEVDS